ncbi:PilZ domain-containing protein [Methylobacterium organophilum]|nr:PilZ domain-containing protein [Methylobacterium organophilum]UMY15811.1 PilZ domain-containing protein [Methylobacterium organophilum]
MLYDISEGGVRLTLPDTGPVPDTFVLVSPCLGEVRVCAVAWRTDETIGAQFKTAA